MLDVSITSSAGATTSKQLEGIQAVCNYVEKKIWELHTAGAGFASAFPQDVDVDEEVAEAHENTGPAFVLPVDAKCMHSLMEKPSKALVIRQCMGTNFTKRLVVGASIVVKNNKDRLVVDARKVWRAATLAEALAEFVASSGYLPEELITCFGLRVNCNGIDTYVPQPTIESIIVLLAQHRCISTTAPCIIAELTAADDSSDIADAAEDVVTRGVHLLRYKYCVTSFRLRSVLQHIVE